jgi:glycosyltransferase involved in cell wall biosynthesis
MQKLSLAEGNTLVNQGYFAESIRCYIKAARIEELIASCEMNIARARAARLLQREGQPPAVAVAAWDLSHNAAGRAVALLELYRYGGVPAELIGCVVKPEHGIWPPVRYLSELTHSFNFVETGCFLTDCLQFVLQHPYDVVHLSKPRIMNMVLGFIYKAVWGSKVIMDVDDEELAFVKKQAHLSFTDFEANGYSAKSLNAAPWTQLAVGSVALFDAITVSNPALQAKYGGLVIPHVRNEALFVQAMNERAEMRAGLGIEPDDLLVIFVGTPRKHKGLLETATALASLNATKVKFLIAGDFPQPELKEELLRLTSLQIVFLPGPSFEQMPALVCAGDVCVLLQDPQSPVAQYQLPAKLVDALAGGLQVFITPTAATQHCVDAGAAVAVTPDNLAAEIRKVLQVNNCRNMIGLDFFAAHLSMAANWPQLQALLGDLADQAKPHIELTGLLHSLCFEPDVFEFSKRIAAQLASPC